MQELITEIAIYLGLAAFLGFLLGYLIWGMGLRRRISAARADGAADARTSVAGDRSHQARIDALTRERDQLARRVETLKKRLADAEDRAAAATAMPAGPAADTPGTTAADARETTDHAPRPSAETGDPDVETGTDGHRMRAAAQSLKGELNQGTAGDDGAGAITAPPAFLLPGPPEVPDDLTRIRGIDGSIAAALNGKGIWLFSQLAGMSPGDIAWLRGQLETEAGRSVDTWPDQARILTPE